MLTRKIKKNKILRNAYFLYRTLGEFFNFKPLLLIKQYVWFFKELRTLEKLGENQNFKTVEYYPCLFDNIGYTPLEATYFFKIVGQQKRYLI